jgi:aarF domain-containing kinase
MHGGDVAVKVMHNGAEDRFHHDFRVFRYLCKVALSGWEPILDECYRQVMNEFDYRKEADSLQEVRDGLGNSRFSKLVSVPRPFAELCTKEILVMEMLHGKKLSEALEEDLEKAVGGCGVDVRDLIKRKRLGKEMTTSESWGCAIYRSLVPWLYLELILGKEKMLNLGYAQSGRVDGDLGVVNKVKLFRLYSKAKKYIDLLVDVQGHQMLSLGCFNGDPHPGNLLILNDGRLGLIDFGQTKRITDDERLGVARVVEAVGNGESNGNIADAMRRLGFRTKLDNDEVLARYAALFFDSDSEGKQLGCATPQMYFSKLNKMDQLIHVPDVASESIFGGGQYDP